MTTISDLKEFQAELKEKFGSEHISYSNVSMTQMSIARHYGGLKINGKFFIYNPKDDSLIREDVIKWIGKQKKKK